MNKRLSRLLISVGDSLKIVIAVAAAAFLVSSCDADCVYVPSEELAKVGTLIFRNECGGKVENLTAWNEGEEFASLGIGHFLWYPAGKQYPFYESFPPLFEFIKSKGTPVPEWMNELQEFDLPWNSRKEFYNDFDSPRMVSLRKLLMETVPLQSLFIARRLERSLPEMLRAAPSGSRSNIRKQFYRVAGSPMGIYALLDYVNFKGEGTSETERYNGEGWGLLQVLENMKGDEEGPEAVREFAESAESMLVRRIYNSPPARNEKRFLPGWRKRLETYTSKGLYAYLGQGDANPDEKKSDILQFLRGLYRGFLCRIQSGA
jgi:hypothetical protein